jgi:predicted RNA-binding protein YlqC (UPF0109 family)
MATSIDQQFIEYIVKSIVNKPDAVSIERRIDEKGVLLELTVDQEDLGRVIGKRGATAQSLRTLLRALGTKNDARYNLKIIDVGPPPNRDSSASQPSASQPSDDNGSAAPADKPATKGAKVKDVSTDEPASTDDDINMDDDELPEEPAATTDHSDLASRTRAELADLDDLDV